MSTASKREPILTVVHALLAGLPIKDGQYTLRLLEREDGKGRDLFFKATRNDDEEVWLQYEMTFGGFVHLCEHMAEDDKVELAMNTALNRSITRPARKCTSNQR